jgi:hypothetical protein
LVEVRGKLFRNEKVRLDGHQYIRCTFENVTFQFGGGPGRVDSSVINGCTIEPTTEELARFAHLLFQFNFLRHPLYGPDGPLVSSNRYVDAEETPNDRIK